MTHWATLVAAARALAIIGLVFVVSVFTATITSALVIVSKELATAVVVAGIVTTIGFAVVASEDS